MIIAVNWTSEVVPVFAAGEIQIDKVMARYDGRKGVLYFTNRRLVFEYAQGLVDKRYFQKGVALSDILGVSASHPRLSWSELIIRTQNTKNGFGVSEIRINTRMNSEMWVKKIDRALLDRGPGDARSDLSVGKEAVRVSCKYCGTLIDASGEHCPNCGAPLH